MESNKMHVSEVLIDALNYMKRFSGQTFIIKFGGEVMVDERVLNAVAEDLIFLSYVNIKPVIVHGGGAEISAMMEKLGKKPVFVKGLRVTDPETMDMVQMILAGKLNNEIVASVHKHGGNAVGISGKSAKLFYAEKADSGDVDLGLVGEITEVNSDVVTTLLDKGYIPVISPIGVAEDGTSLNINADTAAAKLAVQLKANKLIFLTGVEGVLDKNKKLIKTLDKKEAFDLIKKGVATAGMIPKLNEAFYALDNGVNRVHIIHARPHAILEEIFTKEGTGTLIEKKKKK
jgi:acetylglutamate kinase